MKYLEDKRTRSFLIVGVILVAFAFLFIKYDGFMHAMDKLLNVIRPIVIGGFIAFALKNPLNLIYRYNQKRYDKIYNRKLERLKKKNHGVLPAELPPKSKLPLKISIAMVYFLVVLFIVLLVIIIVPQLAESIRIFSDNFEGYYNNIEHLVTKYYNNDQNRTIVKWIGDLNLLDKLYSFAEYIPDLLMKTFGFTADILRTFIDIFLGVILSVYIIAEKSHLINQGERIIKRFCKPKRSKVIFGYIDLVSEKFSNFISGQLTEAFILGMFCFIGMKIFGFDYAILISTIIGITNLVPIVGPIIGTIPGAFILLLAKPTDAIWFVVFVIILQQIESNFIYPRVVGESMGLPALWVSVAVIIGGGFQGILGMIIAIPLMSVIYTVLKQKVDETPDSTVNMNQQ